MKSPNYGFSEDDEKDLTVVDLTFGMEGYSIALAGMSEMVSCFIPSGCFILDFTGSSYINLKVFNCLQLIAYYYCLHTYAKLSQLIAMVICNMMLHIFATCMYDIISIPFVRTVYCIWPHHT